MAFFMLINVKLPTITGISTFMSGKNFLLSMNFFYNLRTCFGSDQHHIFEGVVGWCDGAG